MKRVKIQWIASALVILVMGGVLVLLLISNLNPGTHEPDIELPSMSGGEAGGVSALHPTVPGDNAATVTVTRFNVQKVLASLARPTDYYQRIENVLSYGSESRVTVIDLWRRPEKIVTHTSDSLSDEIVYKSSSGGTLTVWDSVGVISVGDGGDADILAGIPTYEDILKLSALDITAVDYRDWEGIPCIFAEVNEREIGYILHFYVSVESGLLVRAESYSGDEMVYSATQLAYSEDISDAEEILVGI
jgi:hypothetical protein